MNTRELRILVNAAEREDIHLFTFFPEAMDDRLEALEIELENKLQDDDGFELTGC